MCLTIVYLRLVNQQSEFLLEFLTAKTNLSVNLKLAIQN